MSQNHHGSALPPSFLPPEISDFKRKRTEAHRHFCYANRPQRLYSSFTVSSSPDSAFLYRAKRLYALPYLPGYRTDCISYFLFSSAGSLFPYPKQKKLRQKSASLCPDL